MFNEDYFDMTAPRAKQTVPIDRVIARLDELEGKRDYDGAEKHLLYWLREAESVRDERGKFAVLDELMGLYRKEGKRNEAIDAAGRALETGAALHLQGTESFATAELNAATVYKAFGENEKAEKLFESAAGTLEKVLCANHPKLGGLYNNAALNLTDLNRFDEAEAAYKKAMEIMLKNEYGELEAAISWLNLANLYEKRDGLENADAKISDCLIKAQKLLTTPGIPRNGYYAFVCEKCAPTFNYYGRFVFAEDLKETAEEIYERNRT